MTHGLQSAKRPFVSLPVRAQLVIGSMAVLLLLLCVFGVAVRYIASATLMIGVDNDLHRQLAAVTAPHGPPGGGPPFSDHGGPVGPPPLGGGFNHDGANGPPRGGDNRVFGFGSRENGFPPQANRGNAFSDRNRSQEQGGITAADPYQPRRFNAQLQGLGPDDSGLAPIDPAGLRRALAGQTLFSTIVQDGQRVRVLSEPDLTQPPFEQGPQASTNQLNRQDPTTRRRGAAQASYPLGGVDRALRSVDTALLMLIPLALICAGAGGWWITGRALGRVGQITRAAAAIGAQNLSERLPASGNDEFSKLAQAFNGLLNRVDAAFQEQRRFTADASHELKTPLTVIQGTTSLALSLGPEATLDYGAIREIDCAAASMAHLVQDLLYLARADAGLASAANGSGSAQRVELLLSDPIERAVSLVASRSRAAMTFRASETPVCVTASESEMTRLFLNLLENAARYTPAGGQVTVATQLDDDGRTAIATVADTGIGIAPEHLPRLTDRFYRVDDSRTRSLESGEAGGSGLGLAICKSIVESHGGSLEIRSEVGIGTTVTVRLPACATEG